MSVNSELYTEIMDKKRSDPAGAPAHRHELAACESGDDYFSECVEL